ncbi:TlpA family protein disulfide reductase [Foetidibacter luteolus]|uniref:TlpA family protein disulfide reductase n=1 Tax=Foetidibacter luteolus TaxID=2608880 RepID=UPI00129AADEF|nr:TlpA family protein disulfide reductase [Foetidibacter luteolus]
MKRLLLLVVNCCILSAAFTQATPKKSNTAKPAAAGYQIPVTIAPFKNTKLYIGCYYGKYKNLVDSVMLDGQSSGVLKGKQKLPGGIYFAVSPSHTLLFEFLMDDKQQFSIKADTTNPEALTITGSPENTIFQNYTRYLSQKVPRLQQLQQQLKQAGTPADSTRLQTELQAANKELTDYRQNIVKQHPDAMLTAFFKTMKRPEFPAMPKKADGSLDSSYPARYVKEHFWDDVAFDDDRLLRTPFFDPKVDEYFKYYVSPEPDSISAEINYMLLYARTAKDMFKYLLGKFTDKYINPEIMGQDKVFVFLFNNYFSKGDTTWLNAKQKEYIFNRAYSLMANQIGEQAAIMDLVDTTGKETPLYGLTAPFTFVVFWDPNCGHCKEQVPRIDSIYDAKWKAQGVKIYGVNIDEKALDPWKKFIQEHHLDGWAHVYQTAAQKQQEQSTGQPNFRQLYDVFQTPTFYLLDDKKHIIAKKLSIEQFDEVMDAKRKQSAKK